MSWWWVNQGQTYEEERRGGYLWSPKTAQNGVHRPEYDRMPSVKPGDQVFHYAQGAVRAVSRVVRGGYSAAQPAELRSQDMWLDDGWRVDVELFSLPQPLRRDDAAQGYWDEEPFTRNRQVKQGYLYPLSSEFARVLLQRAGIEVSLAARGRSRDPWPPQTSVID